MASHVHASRDPNTLSNYDDFVTTHTVISFNIDFSKEKLSGSSLLHLKAIGEGDAEEIILDTSYLDVVDVYLEDSAAQWELQDRIEPYGSALKVRTGRIAPGKVIKLKVLLHNAQHGVNLLLKVIQIDIKTTKECTALQWLTLAQTSNKKHPYMC